MHQYFTCCLYVLLLEHLRATMSAVLVVGHRANGYCKASWRIQPVNPQLKKNIELFQLHKHCIVPLILACTSSLLVAPFEASARRSPNYKTKCSSSVNRMGEFGLKLRNHMDVELVWEW